MQIICPACGKIALSAVVHTCDRCGCDLSTLRDIRLAANALLREAKFALADGDGHDALAYATRSWTLVHSAVTASVACLAAAALGDPALLARWRRRLD